MRLFSFLLLASTLFFPGVSPAAPNACALLYDSVIGVNGEEARFLDGLEGNLYKLDYTDPSALAKRNRESLRQLRRQPFPVRTAEKRRASFTPAEAEALFKRIMKLGPVQESLCSRYRGSGKMGFCFGRALAVHLEALRSGLQKESIRKAWLVGPLKSGDETWRYHVATILRAPDGSWIAVDPIYDRTMPVEEWVKLLQQTYDPRGEARFFSTPASRLFPYRDQKYDAGQLGRPVFRGFFDDLLELFRREARRQDRE